MFHSYLKFNQRGVCMTNVLEYFLKYISYDTRSNPDSTTFPSTENQFILADLLAEDLKALGLENVYRDENCYVYGTLPANIDKLVPTIGFIAHMDTAPDESGKNVSPRIIEKYDGADIVLNENNQVIMKVKDFPELSNYVGQDLIVTDGTTLLGADDKAGVSEIMATLDYLKNNPSIKHGTIKVAFTPDEEVGQGADRFDVESFGADFGYTIDGGTIGELEYENFNAAGAKIVINGRNVHPGSAKNKMIHSTLIGIELQQMLPAGQRPDLTEGYEGFFLLTDFNGTVEETHMKYIIRDHDLEKFQDKKVLLENVVNFLNQKYGEGTVVLTLKDQYFNMKEKILPVMHIIENAEKAMIKAKVTPIIKPIRGGTDGARLSFMGLPCPNIFTGGHNFHGKYEYIPIQSMHKAVEVILNIIDIYSQQTEH